MSVKAPIKASYGVIDSMDITGQMAVLASHISD